MISYVVGFLFSKGANSVALVNKLKPIYMKGMLNGIGGKINPWESKLNAMKREFKEETGVTTIDTDWTQFCQYSIRRADGSEYQLAFFYCYNDEHLHNVKTMEEEKIGVYEVEDVLTGNAGNFYHNLAWLIPMALDHEVQTAIMSGREEFQESNIH